MSRNIIFVLLYETFMKMVGQGIDSFPETITQCATQHTAGLLRYRIMHHPSDLLAKNRVVSLSADRTTYSME
jgi:hypothetical protein